MRLTARLLTALLTAALVTPTLAVPAVFAAAPVANPDSLTIPEDMFGWFDVLANDTDADADSLTITGVTQGSHGTVSIQSPGVMLGFDPAADYNGPDSFTYTVSDGHGGVATATVDMTVTAVNDPPTFTTAGSDTVPEDSGPRTVPGFATGSAGPPDESQTLAYTIDTDSFPGLFRDLPEISPSGDLTYTPSPNLSGMARIWVHVNDDGIPPPPNFEGHLPGLQSFDITVTAVNDPPVAVADGAYLVKQGTSLPVDSSVGVAANDTDIDTARYLITDVLDTDVTHGTLTLSSDGSFTYTPTGGYVGADAFTYHANDGLDDSNVVTVTLMAYVNHAPVAVPDAFTVTSGSPYLFLSLLTNDNAANPDVGEALVIADASHPAHGTLALFESGARLAYRPATGFVGHDQFTYTVSDGVLSSSALVSINVPADTYKPVVSAPVQTVAGQTIGTTTVVVRLSWSGTDKGSGIKRFELWRSVNGHAYTRVVSTSGQSWNVTTKIGSSYRFRVRAIDGKGNVGSYAYGPRFHVYLYQESSASVSYSIGWAVGVTNPVYSGGAMAGTSSAGSDATFTTVGRTFSFVSAKGPNRGTADVYVDGSLVAHVSLTTTKYAYRQVVYSITFTSSGTHAIRIIFTSLAGKFVNVDAFVLLR